MTNIIQINLDAATAMAGLSMQAWSFHVGGALAIAGWAAAGRSRGAPGLSLIPACLVSLSLALFLTITALNGVRWGERAALALKSAVTDLKAQGFTDAQIAAFIIDPVPNSGPSLIQIIVAVDAVAVVSTFLLFSTFWRGAGTPRAPALDLDIDD